ncbi:MAG: glycosyltransferase family 4 protein [Pseudomonadota bacterium]
MKIALFSPTLVKADAVSNDVFGAARVLDSVAEVKLFANAWDPELNHVSAYTEIPEFITSPQDLLLIHYSIGFEPVNQIARQLPSRTVVKYHNVTPPAFFADYDQDYYRACKGGRDQLPSLVEEPFEFFLSDSDFNQQELITLGLDAGRSAVLAPFHQVDGLLETSPAEEDGSLATERPFTATAVGRLAPNKNLHYLLEVWADFVADFPSAELRLVGKCDDRLDAYRRFLALKVDRLGIGDSVTLTGPVSLRQLKAEYLRANVLCVTSRHEGFCVPAIEAMALGVPVIGCRGTALDETLGDAGILWPGNDPRLLGETLKAIAENPELAAAMVAKGAQRYRASFSNEAIAVRMAELFNQHLGVNFERLV